MAVQSPSSYPSGAYFLTLVGGIIIAFVGVIIFLFAGVVIDLLIPGSTGTVILTLSALGVLVGLLLIVCAWTLKHAKDATPVVGVVIIILALASLPFTLGGFGIGFLLALFGGILAILWKPSQDPRLDATGTAPNMSIIQRVCPTCGALSSPASTFCSTCGKPFGTS